MRERKEIESTAVTVYPNASKTEATLAAIQIELLLDIRDLLEHIRAEMPNPEFDSFRTL